MTTAPWEHAQPCGASGGTCANCCLFGVKRGSSSIKFALFTLAPQPKALCRGALDPSARETAIEQMIERVAEYFDTYPLAGVSHRIVHGGPALRDPQVVTQDVIETLRGLVRFAPNHLPDEIGLIEA